MEKRPAPPQIVSAGSRWASLRGEGEDVRISVECGGFTRAADACLAANQTSAVLAVSLTERLAPTAGMAGNDATSTDFARAYDASAAEAVAALVDLTHAFIGAGRLLTASGANHASAEGGAGAPSVLGYDGGSISDSAYVRVRPGLVPSSLGSQEPSLGVVDSWILDQLEGFAWPGADVQALRAAATAWRRAAASTSSLADHIDVATTFLEAQHSPEVPLAVDALTELNRLVGDTAWQLSGIADACEEYADAVESAHDRTRALLSEVAQMIVEGAAISVVVTGLTGGLGGAASVAAAAAKVRSHAPRFHALLTALRVGAAASASRLERVRDELTVVRAKVERFVRVPVRNEVGAIRPSSWVPGGPGWLRAHEIPPGHTIERHVGKTMDELAQRFAGKPGLKRASTFDDQASAERLIEAVLSRRSDEIRTWLMEPTSQLTLVEDLGERTGRSLSRDGTVLAPTGVRVILLPDSTAASGWRILTAFPD